MSNTVKLPTCPKCGAPIPIEAPQGLCPKCVLLGAATATEQGVPATATSEIPSLERIAAAFPQLEILELIGRGGMGFVFKARQPHLDRFVALKLLPDKLAKDAQFAERFNREGRVLAKLNHPNIVSVFDFGQAGGFYYLAMEYVDGVNLRQAMRAGRFSPAEALSIVPKVCEALQYAHEQGILHRDIKPENILLDAKGRVKIADFGIAKLVGEDQPNITLTNTGAALGTPHYMAPEQLEKPATVDHRADIYSLGVVFYEMLTGELPIGRFAAPSSKTPVNSTVDDVVFRTLEKDRERRFQSAGEMRTQVQNLHADAPPVIEPTAPPKLPAPSWVKRLGVLYCVLAGVAVVPTFAGIGTNYREYHSAMLLAFTGIALLSRISWWRSAALVANALGLAVPLISVISVVMMSRNGTLPAGWNWGIPGLPNVWWLTLLLTVLHWSTFVVGLWVLLRRDVRGLFPPRSESGISHWAIYGTISVGLSLPVPFAAIVAVLGSRGDFGPRELWLALGSVALPGLGGTLLGWLALNEIRESRSRVKGLPLAMFATLFWPLTILGALTIGVPMSLVARVSTPSAADTIGRFLVLLLPAAVIAFSFWTIHSIARWASQQQVTPQRGLLKWVFIVVLVIGMGVLLVFDQSRSRSRATPGDVNSTLQFDSLPVTNYATVDVALDPLTNEFRIASAGAGSSANAPAASPATIRRIELQIPNIENNVYWSVGATTDSELPPGEYLVGLMERPDGRIEDVLPATTIYSGGRRPRVTRHIIWPLSKFDTNLVRSTDAEMRRTLDGRVVELGIGRSLNVFAITNSQGAATRGQLALRRMSDDLEEPKPVTVALFDTPANGSFGPFFLNVKIRISAPLGLQPYAVGELGDGSNPEAHTSIQSGGPGGSSWNGSHCYWYFPPEFGNDALHEVVRQLNATKAAKPNGFQILPGQRVPVFSVTNQAGIIFRGYFALPPIGDSR